MPRKIWQVDDIENHLLTIKVSMEANTSFLSDKTEELDHLNAYQAGCDLALRTLAQRFGLNMSSSESKGEPAAHRSGLRTWTREEIRKNLKVVRAVLLDAPYNLPRQNPKVKAFRSGIGRTLEFVALSFGLDNDSMRPTRAA